MDTSGSEIEEVWRRNPNWSKPAPKPHIPRTPGGRVEVPKGKIFDFPGTRPHSSFSENYLGAAGKCGESRSARTRQRLPLPPRGACPAAVRSLCVQTRRRALTATLASCGDACTLPRTA
eukprot:2584385-Prymnesium_polylepis.1